jgi:hypothetical protein
LQSDRLGVASYSTDDCILRFIPVIRVLQGSGQQTQISQIIKQLKSVINPTVILTKSRSPEAFISLLKEPTGISQIMLYVHVIFNLD